MIETKCKSCYGCNRLAQAEFKEIYRCENYMRAETKEEER